MYFKKCFKKVLVLAVVTMLLPGLVLFSASSKADKALGKKGATVTIANGTLIYWKDLKKVTFDKANPRRMKPVLNFEDPTKIVKKSMVADPVVQKSQPSKLTSGIMALTNPIKNFEAMNLMENGSGWPPDTNGDVGINHYVQTVNTSIGIYDKATGKMISTTFFDDLFPPAVGTPCDYENNGDPIVLFDQINKRWFILDFAWTGTTNGSYYSIAASVTADPTGAWWLYCFKADDVLMNDYPKCGIWHDGVYVTANMFAFGGSYQTSKIWAIKTPDIYKGTLTAQSTTTMSLRSFSIMPSNARGKIAPHHSAPNYLYSIDADEFGGLHTDALHVWKYKVDWRTPANTTFTGPTILPVAPYDLTSSRVPQLGTAWTLDSLYGRLMYSTVYRRNNAGSGGAESVYLSHTAEYMGRRAVRWYEVRIKNGVSSVYQQGTYSPDANHRWMGSVCADKHGNIAIGYSTSSTKMYPAIQYAGRRATDPKGIMGQGEKTLINGTGAQTRISRWGDYSMMSIDPVDDETFWYTQEYYLTSAVAPQLPDWRTRVVAFKITPAGPPKDLAEALDSTDCVFTTSGTGVWAYQKAVSCSGGDAAKSPVLGHNRSASMSTTISGQIAVKFYWKVSSQANFDYLKFFVDGVLIAQISGNVNWKALTVPVTTGAHTLTWTYAKNSSISSGSDAGWVDNLELNNGVGIALDLPAQNFMQTGTVNFDITTVSPFYGPSCIMAPDSLTNSESTIVEANITGKTSVKFYWKASSEDGWDYLNFYIDGVLTDQISGEVDWTQQTYTVSKAAHKLTWAYIKDSADSAGADTGWVDRVEIN